MGKRSDVGRDKVNFQTTRNNLENADSKKNLKRKYVEGKDVKAKRVRLQNEKIQDMIQKQKEDEERGSTYCHGMALQESLVPMSVKEIEEQIKRK